MPCLPIYVHVFTEYHRVPVCRPSTRARLRCCRGVNSPADRKPSGDRAAPNAPASGLGQQWGGGAGHFPGSHETGRKEHRWLCGPKGTSGWGAGEADWPWEPARPAPALPHRLCPAAPRRCACPLLGTCDLSPKSARREPWGLKGPLAGFHTADGNAEISHKECEFIPSCPTTAPTHPLALQAFGISSQTQGFSASSHRSQPRPNMDAAVRSRRRVLRSDSGRGSPAAAEKLPFPQAVEAA